MNQEVVTSKASGAERAAEELCSKLHKSPAEYSAVIFFASSSYDFAKLSEELKKRFPKAEVIGSSTSGEISPDGFESRTVVLNALYDRRTRFKAVLVDNIDKFPVVHKQDIVHAASSIGIRLDSPGAGRDAFAITLVCGLLNAEEGLLSLLYSVIKAPDFQLAGGSAGDDLKFKATWVSANGVSSSCAGVVLFVHTESPFCIHKENIFKRSGKTVMLTDVEPATHTVRSIDGKNPLRRYAEVLGISEAAVGNAILDHPFGRAFGDNVFIASLIQFDKAGILTMYARVLQGSQQEILEPLDAVQVAQQSCETIHQKIPHPGCVILFNCILRTIGFQQKRLQRSINDVWKQFYPVYSGFSTYGEQFGHINSNQTLVTLAIGE